MGLNKASLPRQLKVSSSCGCIVRERARAGSLCCKLILSRCLACLSHSLHHMACHGTSLSVAACTTWHGTSPLVAACTVVVLGRGRWSTIGLVSAAYQQLVRVSSPYQGIITVSPYQDIRASTASGAGCSHATEKPWHTMTWYITAHHHESSLGLRFGSHRGSSSLL